MSNEVDRNATLERVYRRAYPHTAWTRQERDTVERARRTLLERVRISIPCIGCGRVFTTAEQERAHVRACNESRRAAVRARYNQNGD